MTTYFERESTQQLRALITTQPQQFKGQSILQKARSKQYQTKWFFKTNFFHNYAYKAIEDAIISYNNQDSRNDKRTS